MITDQQVRLLRQKRMEGKTQETAAAIAGMSERSARKWQCGSLPSETKQERWWRTRPDPFDGVWDGEILPHLVGQGRGVVGTDHLRSATQGPQGVLESLLQGQKVSPVATSE